MTRPPVGVSPIVVSMHLPPSTAAMTGAIPQMGDDHTTVGRVRPGLASQLAQDVLIRQSVKAVTPDAFLFELRRKGINPGDPRHVRVKGRIETGDLRERRVRPADNFDRLDFVRQMIGGQRDQFPQ